MREMKDSGVEWIGKISKTFKVSRIKFCYKVILGKMVNSTRYPEESMSNYLCAANIKWNGVDTSIHKKMYISKKEKLNILLDKGDILIMEGGNAGTACIYNNEFYPCYIQNSVHRCFGINGFINNYLYYWMFVVFHSDYINLICNKATIRHYTKEKVDNTPIVVPCSLNEQKEITDFLDRKCSEIDALISDIQTQIETLEEYKKSVITEAVTKGLDPNVEMKDSGIQWVDKIPVSWKISKIKYISNSIFKGQGIKKEDVDIRGDIQCVRYGEIYSKYSNSFSQCFSFINSNNLHPKQPFIKNGDIIFAITGELIEEIGKNILYTGELDCAVGGDIVVARIDEDRRFVNYALNSSYCQNQKSCNKFKLKVVHISAFEIGNIIVLLPPLTDQKCIADFLDQKCSEIDQTISEKKQQLETLAEYKKSLIYECVTGKKEIA